MEADGKHPWQWPFSPPPPPPSGWDGKARGRRDLSAEYSTASTISGKAAATALSRSRDPVWGRGHAVNASSAASLRRRGQDDGLWRGLVYELMPLVWTLRLTLMLPITILPNEKFRFRWLSLPTALTFLAWCVLMVITFFTVRTRLELVNSEGKHFHVWDLVPKYASSVSLGYIVFLPFTSWAITGRAVDMIEDWKAVEAMITSLQGAVPLPRLRGHAWMMSGFCVLFPVAMQTMGTLLLPDQAVWMVPAQMHSISFLMLASAFWNVSCRALALIARHQAASMADDFKLLGVFGLRRHRRIWLGLVKVLRGLSASWGRTQTLLIGICFVSIVSISFLLTHLVAISNYDGRATWLLLALVLATFGIVSVCASAQIVTDAMRTPARMQLLELSFQAKDEESVTEIAQFLEDIYLERPEVSICRLGVLGRSSILSIFALANTYIVVLSQFSLSIETSKTNFTVDPAAIVGGALEET